MNSYFILKWAHILGATILFGTGIWVSHFFKWITDRGGDIRAIRTVSERTVLADWIFTTPTAILQPITGIGLAYWTGYSITTGWILYATPLCVIAGACWLPVVYLQIRMRKIAGQADREDTPLPTNTGYMHECGFGWVF